MESIRWAVNCAEWAALKQEYLLALACVQCEEGQRISKFVFRRDAKLALVGRLLLRAALVESVGVSNGHISLGRSSRGRPVLVAPRVTHLDFNVSHQGKYSVLALEMRRPVGVDVMQLTRPRGQSLPEFFHTMRGQFTESEWTRIRGEPSERNQLAMFYRFWCLKESFIKADGTGLSFGLQRLEFVPHDLWPPPLGEVKVGSLLHVDGQWAKDWVFEEMLIDREHCAAVAVGTGRDKSHSPVTFSLQTVPDLLARLSPLRTVDGREWETFAEKDDSPRTN